MINRTGDDPEQLPEPRKTPSTVWIGVAFIPWILYWILSAFGMNLQAVALALTASVILNAHRVRIRKIMIMDAVTLLFFVVNFTVTLLVGGAVVAGYVRLAVYLTLCGMAFGSLAIGNPFTYQYARQDVSERYWGDPIFRSTNEIITAVWGFVFLLEAVFCHVGSLFQNVYVSTVIPSVLLGVGIVFSMRFPKWYPRKVLERMLRERRKGEWPRPSFMAERKLGENEYDIVIVGSGMGGLSCGALLAMRGLKVLVVEQHHMAGGYCTSFPRKGGSVFDVGVHDISGLGAKGPVRFLLRELGVEDKLQFERVTTEYVSPETRLQIPFDYRNLIDLLAAHFPDERENISTFFAEMKGAYDEMYMDIEERGGVLGPPETADEMLKYPLTHPHLYRWLDKSYLEMLDSYFTDQKLKKILCMLTGYLTDNPRAVQVSSMAPIFGYYFDGGYYPKGGSHALAKILVSVIEGNDGVVLLNSKVEQLIVKDGVAQGISVRKTSPESPSEKYRATVVVSNADVKETFLQLIAPDHLPAEYLRRVEGIEPSTSAFLVFLSLDYDPQLAPLAFFASRSGLRIGVAIPSKLDRSLAAPGGNAATVLALMPNSEAKAWKRNAPDYETRKEAFMEQLIDAAAELLPDLRQHVVHKEAATPATFHRYTSSWDGAIYGPGFGQQLRFKPPVRNLYLVGSGAFPGPGIEAVVISALIAANDILPRKEAAKHS